MRISLQKFPLRISVCILSFTHFLLFIKASMISDSKTISSEALTTHEINAKLVPDQAFVESSPIDHGKKEPSYQHGLQKNEMESSEKKEKIKKMELEWLKIHTKFNFLLTGPTSAQENIKIVNELLRIYFKLQRKSFGIFDTISQSLYNCVHQSRTWNLRTWNHDRNLKMNPDTWTNLKNVICKGILDNTDEKDKLNLKYLNLLLLLNNYMVEYHSEPSALIGFTTLEPKILTQVVEWELDHQGNWFRLDFPIPSAVIPTLECLSNYKGMKQFNKSIKELSHSDKKPVVYASLKSFHKSVIMNSDPKKHTQEFIKIVDPFFANDFLYKADALSESSFKLFECLHSPPNHWTYMHQKLQKKLSANLSSHQVIQTIQNAYRFFQNPSDMSVKGPINELMSMYFVVEFLESFYPNLVKVIIPVKIHDRELIKDQLEFMKEAFNIFENEE
ncbi:hypothetical protein PGT21_011330 [Puccinia graminis f. sp. tritici]|uniref:Uncharacterized protein n=1 Tax=Puccinia graminis f. sp. tritici TaxID=56615 RepID=A0A5B0LL79_PUCGR|nr:hypothetical protein PGT21_011330 [Puccinia graminis f. sp. tritici]